MEAAKEMIYKITHDNLPEAIYRLHLKVDRLLSQTRFKEQHDDEDRLMTIEQFIAYLPIPPKRQTVYGCITLRCVPYEKHGKRLYFRKSIIDLWLANGREMK